MSESCQVGEGDGHFTSWEMELANKQKRLEIEDQEIQRRSLELVRFEERLKASAETNRDLQKRNYKKSLELDRRAKNLFDLELKIDKKRAIRRQATLLKKLVKQVIDKTGPLLVIDPSDKLLGHTRDTLIKLDGSIHESFSRPYPILSGSGTTGSVFVHINKAYNV